MSLAPRRLAVAGLALIPAMALVVPSAAASPDVDTESAATVIEGLHGQGYRVEITGVPSGDTALLTNCTVTDVRHAGTTLVYVDVACPIQRN